MMKSHSRERKDTNTQQRKPLLATRFLNALPYASSVKDYYYNTKTSNELLKVGLNLAETCAVKVSAPFVSKYAIVDRFAASQLDKLEDAYGENLISKSVGIAIYPFAYTFGLAQFTKNKVVGIATPAIEMTFELADVLVDNLMPADSDETLTEEYARLSNLQQKSPFRRIRNRANVRSVVFLPANAWTFSRNVISSTVYTSLGFSTMLLSRLFNNVSSIVQSITSQSPFELLQHPWTVLTRGDMSKLYHALTFHGVKYVNQLLTEANDHALELSQYLEQHKLPYNSQLVAFAAQQLRKIQKSLVKIGGLQIEYTEEQVPSLPVSRGAFPHRIAKARTIDPSPSHRIVHEGRMPSIMLGNQFDQHMVELEADRMPTMMWGDEISSPADSEESTPYVDGHGFAPCKPRPHDHLLPINMARAWGNQLRHPHQIPTTPTNSPADTLPNNPYAEICVGEDELVGGPDAEETKWESKTADEEARAGEQDEKKKADAEWEAPKHPIYVHVEEPIADPNPDASLVLENNPFGKLAEVPPTEDPISIGVSSM